MTGAEVAQIITSVAALIGAFGSVAALVMSTLNRRGIHDVRKDMNGIQAKLVSATHKEGVSEGTAIGLEQGRQENRDENARSRN